MGDLAAEPGEDLDDGYRASTPPGDNLVIDFVRAEAEAYRVLVAAAGGRVVDDAATGLLLADTGVASPFGNVAMLTRPAADGGGPALADALRSFFGARPGGPYLVFSAWPVPPLGPDGFHPVGHPPLMRRPPAAAAVPPPDGLRIAEVADDDALADFELTLIEAYPTPELLPYERGVLLAPALVDSSWRFFVGYDADRPVATAAAYVTDHIVTVEMVATRPEWRGRGAGAALTAAAAGAAPELPSALIASDLGRGVYADLGFEPMLRYTLWLGVR